MRRPHRGADALGYLGFAAAAAGRPVEALDDGKDYVLAALDDLDSARTHWRLALAVHTETGTSDIDRIAAHFDRIAWASDRRPAPAHRSISVRSSIPGLDQGLDRDLFPDPPGPGRGHGERRGGGVLHGHADRLV